MALVASEDNLEKEKQISIDPTSLKHSSVTARHRGGRSPPLPSLIAPVVVHTNNKARSLLKFFSSNNQQREGRSGVALRSMSCGPCDDMDLWLDNPYTAEDKTWVKRPNATQLHNKSISKMEMETKWRDGSEETSPDENQFRCGALCLFLPGLGKGKPVQAKKDHSGMDNVNEISRRVSLEIFECGSWAASAIEIGEDGNSGSLYFDLPLELIRNSVDAHAPANSGFVFNKDGKGVLRNGLTDSVKAKSNESAHSVHF